MYVPIVDTIGLIWLIHRENYGKSLTLYTVFPLSRMLNRSNSNKYNTTILFKNAKIVYLSLITDIYDDFR